MLRTVLWSVCLSAVVAVPAHAQGKKIVTINPDGSVTVTDQESGAAQQLPSPRVNPRRQPPFVDALPPEEQKALRREQARPAAPEMPRAPDEPAVPSVPVKQAAPEKPAVTKPVAGKADKAVTPPAPKPEKKTVAKPKVKKPAPAAKPKLKEAEVMRGEPAARGSIGRVDPKRASSTRHRGGPVTAEEAKRIAIDVGPPAFGVDAYPADYEGRKVFQVVFRTEDGERYVLVDRASGEIVRE